MKWPVTAHKAPVRRGHRPAGPPAGEARVDFGHAEAILDGRATTVALFVMPPPDPDAIFGCASPHECTEAFP